MNETEAIRLTNIDRRARRLPHTDDELMKAVALSLLTEIKILHRLIETMALGIPRDHMDEREGQMLDAILADPR